MCREVLDKILPIRFRRELSNWKSPESVQEIRVRKGKNIYLIGADTEWTIDLPDGNGQVTEEDLREMTEYISGYSMYAHEEELRQGFLTLKGGHRVGITGDTVLEHGKIKTMKNLSSFNIRISHSVEGCGNELLKYAKRNLLLISPPRMGKTTLLRDLLRHIANIPMENVGIVDERSEIASCYRGIPQHDLGQRVDILNGCPKAEGMLMLLRSMSPSVIGVDELGKEEDVNAVLRVVNCGVRVIATVHGENSEEIRQKKMFRDLFEQNIFTYFATITCGEIIVENQSGEIIDRLRRNLRREA